MRPHNGRVRKKSFPQGKRKSAVDACQERTRDNQFMIKSIDTMPSSEKTSQ